MTVSRAREILLGFEGAEEGAHHGHPDFRVRGKIFATLGSADGHAVLRLPLEFAEPLINRFRLVSRFGGMGWLAIELANADESEFSDLASLAHQLRQDGPTR